jgi:hypothetical protein
VLPNQRTQHGGGMPPAKRPRRLAVR